MIETNLKEEGFLDVSFNLRNGNCHPYKKPSDSLLYIHNVWNHQPNVIKQMMNSIQERLSKNSSNEEICNTAKCEYEGAMEKSGFKVDFEYIKNQREKPKNRSRNIIWSNPPFNKSVSTNIEKIFPRLINRHFPKSHRLHKIFNSNTMKVSCSCIQNMPKINKGHNTKIISTVYSTDIM